MCPKKTESGLQHQIASEYVNAESRCKCDKELSDSSLLLYTQHFHKQDPTAPCSFPAGNKAAIQHITSTFRDADCRHICNYTGLDPPRASPGVEQQFAVKPHQTSSSVVCCLIPLYSDIDKIESLGVPDVRCIMCLIIVLNNS